MYIHPRILFGILHSLIHSFVELANRYDSYGRERNCIVAQMLEAPNGHHKMQVVALQEGHVC